jgi:diguanylate cyclase (GGDEF)-like protein
MGTAFIRWGSRPDLWAAAIVLAVFACYVCLNLARGAFSSNRATAWRALVGAGLALSAGVWGVHFVVLSDGELPTHWRYDGFLAFGAMPIAWAIALLALRMGVVAKASWSRRFGAAALLGLGLSLSPFLELIALELQPAVRWDPLLLAGGWAAATLAAGLAMVIASRWRRSHGPLLTASWQLVAAVLLTVGLSATNAAVMAAASVAAPKLTYSSGSMFLGTFTGLAFVGVTALLGLLLVSSIVETRFKAMLREARDELYVVAHTDGLTRLPNRKLFEDRLQRAVLQADRSQHRMALMMINLDGLKFVNQSFGQVTGDKVLREMGTRLRALVPKGHLVARAGGDEFLLLLEANPDVATAGQLAELIIKGVNRNCVVDGNDIAITCSVGVAMYPEHASLPKLIAHASAAMHTAKRKGGAAHNFFESSMVASDRDQMALLNDLRRAIDNRELEMHFQPKVHAPSGQITGAEALMRWHHPTRGMVGPNIFIPLAERFGLINAMGNWLIDDVCRQVAAWRAEGLRMRVSINLSVHQLRQPDLVDRIRDALQRHRVDPSLLTCEITESTAMDDTRITLQVIERMSAMGVRLSIDDFGTGYSSLSYLRQLAATELKIDRSFVLDLETSADARAIVDAVVKLAQALGLKVVAEGVETEQQQEILRELGCNELQGYLFAKPMSASALALWAMQDEGPRAIDFRPSLFGDTLAIGSPA